MLSIHRSAACIGILSLLMTMCHGAAREKKEVADAANPFSMVRSDSVQRESGDSERNLIQTQSASLATFAVDMYHRLCAEQEGNIFFSPYSITSAVGMISTGAQGKTEKEIREVFRVTLPGDAFHSAINSFDQDMEKHAEAFENLTLNVTNDAWVQKGWDIRDSFLHDVNRFYGAGINLLDFIRQPEESRHVVNTWIAEKTNRKITNLLAPGSITPLTRLIITNAVYFLANWEYRFDENLTADEPFRFLDGTKITVPMMQLGTHGERVELRYSWNKEHKVRSVELPYSGNRLAMILFLPDTGAFEAFESALSPELLETIITTLSPRNLPPVKLPRFTFTSPAISLKKALQHLGMTQAFDPKRADFSGIIEKDELFIHDIVHKAFIKVDEAGTEAAAATAVLAGATSVPVHIPRFVADRPFLFCIRDTQTGMIIFMGKVLNPTREQ